MTIPTEIRQEIQRRLQEIETYRSHYLYKEARVLCKELAAFIGNTPAIANKQKLFAQLSSKVKKIEAELKSFNAFSSSVEMSLEEQAVVQKLFTSGKTGSASAAFEAATALQIFGQHAAAIRALQPLLEDDAHRIAAAKSILRCHFMEGHIQKAANQYLDWLKDDTLPYPVLDSVHTFLQAALAKKGYKQQLPAPVMIEEIEFYPEPEDEMETDDLLSIVLPYMASGKRITKKEVLLDVNFQSGNMINCIVPRTETGIVGFLKPGTIFPEVQINGTDMITFRAVRLSEVSKIKVGKHAGDTTITLRVMDD